MDEARRLRFLASYTDLMAARLRMAAAAHEAVAATAGFAEAWQVGVDSDVAAHPDLAELNVKMDAYYG